MGKLARKNIRFIVQFLLSFLLALPIVLSGKSLNVASNSLIAGGKMIQWPYSAADNMTFQLIPLN